MRGLPAFALLVSLAASISSGQQNNSSTPPLAQDAQPERVKVYASGPGVTAPELLPRPPFSRVAGKCKKSVDGTVKLSIIVDAAGQPRNIMFLHPLASDLDEFALQVAAADRFKPGTYNGAPVAVAQSLEVDLQACVAEKKNDKGKKAHYLRIRALPVQKLGAYLNPLEEAVLSPADIAGENSGSSNQSTYRIGKRVSAPIVLSQAEAEFSDNARRAKYQGTCLVSLIVDEHGMPRQIQVVRPLDYGLSEKSVEAVGKYRFKPAMKDGQPVPVQLMVAVDFRLY